MRAVMLDVPESLLDERRRLGLDVFDEVWGGVLHMVPPPSGEHQRLASEMLMVLLAAAKVRRLVASHETGMFAESDDYRIPDLIVSRPEHCSRRGVDGTAELVVELHSPHDEADEKLPWYATRGVTEILVVDPPTRSFELYRSEQGVPVPVSPDGDGGITLKTLGVRLSTVASTDGPRLRLESDGASTDC
jgi:Uma2 family endonuclease